MTDASVACNRGGVPAGTPAAGEGTEVNPLLHNNLHRQTLIGTEEVLRCNWTTYPWTTYPWTTYPWTTYPVGIFSPSVRE
jgi:hypothetical protein